MTVLDRIAAIRTQYIDLLRAQIRNAKAEGRLLGAEVGVRAPATPDQHSPRALHFDMFVGTQDQPQPAVVMTGPVEGPLLGALSRGSIEAAIFPFAWEACPVWLRHSSPDWSLLHAWFDSWFDDSHRTTDEDGLSGVVHYLSDPTPEGGGYLLEIDFGSASIDAFIALLDTLDKMGATEIRIGTSDGSDMDPAVAAALQSPDLTSERFTALAAELMRQIDEVETVSSPAELVLTLRMSGAKDATVANLDNLWRRLQRIPGEQRPREVARFIRTQREAHHAVEGVPGLETLRPVIKDSRFVDHVDQQMKRRQALACTRFVGDLWIACVWDMPNGMRFVMATEPPQFGLTLEDTHKRALENYLHALRSVDTTVHDAVTIARTNDDYDASLLLDNAFWTDLQKKFAGDLLVCVPTRNAVLITSTLTPGGESQLRALARQHTAAGDHLISETILRRATNTWTVHSLEHSAAPPPIENRRSKAESPLPPPKRKPWWRFW